MNSSKLPQNLHYAKPDAESQMFLYLLQLEVSLFVCFVFLDTSYQMGLQIARFTMRQEETLYSPCFLLTTSESLAPEKCSEVQPRKTRWGVFL